MYDCEARPCNPQGKAPKGAKGGRKGARVRASRLTPEQKSDIARIAAEARWKKKQSWGACSLTRSAELEVRFRGRIGMTTGMADLLGRVARQRPKQRGDRLESRLCCSYCA